MKVVILAGGLGTRISEETHLKPKPMIEIGGKPILWHIMKIYSHYGFKEFIICCGYKGYLIKEYFANYSLHMSDITFDMENNNLQIHQKKVEPWKITLINTGEDSQTGGRLKAVYDYVKDEESFCFTYGDGVSNINIQNLVKFHNSHKKLATVTAVKPVPRYGSLEIESSKVKSFAEKPSSEGGLINGGFFVLRPQVISFVKDIYTSWEENVLPELVKIDQLMAYEHYGFWRPMDTLRDKRQLEEVWAKGNPPWKVWEK